MPLVFPEFDPIALDLFGVFQIRWYALAYIAGFLAGWKYVAILSRRRARLLDYATDSDTAKPGDADIADLLTWLILGVVIGGRLGFVLFYNPGYYLEEPLEALMIWRGGMSFHGGMLGAAGAILLFARRRGIEPLVLGDLVCAAAPIGLFFGRIANFINGELWGRISDAPWAMIFPAVDDLPRHPSQLYQAGLEGIILFAVLLIAAMRRDVLKRPGLITALFLIGYAVTRSIGELYRWQDPRLPDVPLLTYGQWLSMPMLAAGIVLLLIVLRRSPPDMRGTGNSGDTAPTPKTR